MIVMIVCIHIYVYIYTHMLIYSIYIYNYMIIYYICILFDMECGVRPQKHHPSSHCGWFSNVLECLGSNFLMNQNWLVVWNMAFMTFHSVGNGIIPTDEVIFFRGVGQPPTSIYIYIHIYIYTYILTTNKPDNDFPLWFPYGFSGRGEWTIFHDG